jgi:hypothetical protein
MLKVLVAAVFTAIFATSALAADAKVGFENLQNGEIVHSPFVVKFAISGMALAPAGSDTPNSGHHHLLVDAPLPADMKAPLPVDEHHLHFGKAQTEAQLTLPKGVHTLQLLLADSNHVPHNPPVMSQKITITVE